MKNIYSARVIVMSKYKIKALLGKKVMSESDTVHLLSLIRKEIETLNKIEVAKQSDLKLFCDWALHKKIDKSPAGSQLVSLIHRTINLIKNENNEQVIQEISKTLLMPFRKQFKYFLEKNSFHTNIIDDCQKWKCFLKALFEVIESIPVILKSKHEEDLQADPIKVGMWVEEISVIRSNLENTYHEEIFCLQITTSDTTVIIIPLTPC